jgi:hypothetical protein
MERAVNVCTGITNHLNFADLEFGAFGIQTFGFFS